MIFFSFCTNQNLQEKKGKTPKQNKCIQWTVGRLSPGLKSVSGKAIVARISEHKPERLLPLRRKPLKTCPAAAVATVGLRRIPDWLKEVR